MKYLLSKDILQIHFEIVEKTGGFHGIKSTDLLKSSVIAPQTNYGGKDNYSRLILKSAALVLSLVKNQPFKSANKKTALLCLLTFLELNSEELEADGKEIRDFLTDIENKEPKIEDTAKWIKRHSA